MTEWLVKHQCHFYLAARLFDTHSFFFKVCDLISRDANESKYVILLHIPRDM